MIWTTVAASLTVVAKQVRQSNDAQAGTTPVVLTRPTVPFSPTHPFSPAGIRPAGQHPEYHCFLRSSDKVEGCRQMLSSLPKGNKQLILETIFSNYRWVIINSCCENFMTLTEKALSQYFSNVLEISQRIHSISNVCDVMAMCHDVMVQSLAEWGPAHYHSSWEEMLHVFLKNLCRL